MTSAPPVGAQVPSLAGAEAPGGSRRISAVDASWVGHQIACVMGPVDVPGREALVDAVRRCAAMHPASRLTWTLDVRRGRWSWPAADAVADHAERVVGVLHRRILPGNPADAVAVLDEVVALRDPALPLQLLVGEEHLVLRMDHAVGDGHVLAQLIPGLVQAARTGGAPGWPERAADHPVRSALARHFGAHPRRLPSALRHARQARGWADGEAAGVSAPPDAVSPARPDAEGALGSASRRTLYTSVSAATWSGARRWARGQVQGTTSSSLALVALLRALRQAGLDASADVLVLRDLRRHLSVAADGHVWGNFVVGAPTRVPTGRGSGPGSAAVTSAALAGRLTAEADAGRPLLTLAASAALPARRRAALAQLRSLGASAGGTVARCRMPVAFSYVGRPREVERLPWRPGAARTWGASVPPLDPGGVSFAVCETGGALQISASTHAASTFGGLSVPGAVATALDLLSADPVAVLTAKEVPT